MKMPVNPNPPQIFMQRLLVEELVPKTNYSLYVLLDSSV